MTQAHIATPEAAALPDPQGPDAPGADPLGPGAKDAAEGPLLAAMVARAGIGPDLRARAQARAVGLVRRLRDGRPALIETVMAEYGLSTREGVALMCLAEALLRVPDAPTVDALIADKIAPSDWSRHLGAASPLVNASTWGLMLTGRVLAEPEPGLAGTLRGLVRRLGEPTIRAAVGRAMREMGRQFVLGETIDAALDRAAGAPARVAHSFDMLGEAAMTQADADRYARAYAGAIGAIGARDDARGDGISIKLSALHPRFEPMQRDRVMAELVPVVAGLARQARAAGVDLQVDAEEQDRLRLTLDVVEAVLADPELAGWEGFGVVVQAYGRRAGAAIDALAGMAARRGARMNLRLVKGAYWDTEMKAAQVRGLGFPLWTTKAGTDVAYLCLARRLLSERWLHPQFATHNAHTVAAILEMAEAEGTRALEFQRLHGMGARLHEMVRDETGLPCRVYAPVGAHRDLLAYLVRRLLENGANSSFVHRITDADVPPEAVAADPFDALKGARAPAGLVPAADLFGARANARGWDIAEPEVRARLRAGAPLTLAEPVTVTAPSGNWAEVTTPASGAVLGRVREADGRCVDRALADAVPWEAAPGARAAALRGAADALEADAPRLVATLTAEAGKVLADCVAEIREAVDFLRYYAAEGEGGLPGAALGVVSAISPWNFPLAIFTGQVAAALMAGNAVLAKPAPQTPLSAALAVEALHRAGVPRAALQLLPGGPEVGRRLTSDPRVAGVVFTGSTATARAIARAMADHLAPGVPLIAETGGLNAMVIDSTALPEQAVRDAVASAFGAAGQRCSALRCLYVQEDVAPGVEEMLRGAMDALVVGCPSRDATDVGPVIDAAARDGIAAHVRGRAGDVIHRVAVPRGGTFVAPTLIRVGGIGDVGGEVFGPVLHVATFPAGGIARVMAEIAATGFGLTFGLHSRIDARVQRVAGAAPVGNAYVNRNQVGAVVGSQPFGGEGLSGTGPKAGGPLYLGRLRRVAEGAAGEWDGTAGAEALRAAVAGAGPGDPPPARDMPGPTGELNRLSFHSRAPVLCLGPGRDAAEAQAATVRALGGRAAVAPGRVAAEEPTTLEGIAGAIWWGGAEAGRAHARALAAREGPILPLVTGAPDAAHALHERHLCVDTTAAGGNAALLAG